MAEEVEKGGRGWRTHKQQSNRQNNGGKLGSRREGSFCSWPIATLSRAGKCLQCCPRDRDNKASRGGAFRVDSSSRRSPQRTQTSERRGTKALINLFLSLVAKFVPREAGSLFSCCLRVFVGFWVRRPDHRTFLAVWEAEIKYQSNLH